MDSHRGRLARGFLPYPGTRRPDAVDEDVQGAPDRLGSLRFRQAAQRAVQEERGQAVHGRPERDRRRLPAARIEDARSHELVEGVGEDLVGARRGDLLLDVDGDGLTRQYGE